MDPSSFLQPASEAVVDLDMQCNEVVTSVGGVVVDRNTLVTGSPAQRLIGTSLTGVCFTRMRYCNIYCINSSLLCYQY